MAYKPLAFLEKYDTILFDMDGVITSEEMYWKAAALTVYEFLNSKKYYGAKDIIPSECEKRADEFKTKYFCDDKIIKYVKKQGLNNNWDLAYIVIAVALHLETDDDFEAVFEYIKGLNMNGLEMCSHAEELLSEDLCVPKEHVKRFGSFWTDVQHCFQEWFLGNKLFPLEWKASNTQLGKSGMMYMEVPVVDKERLTDILRVISKTHTLGIGTGRPKTEALNALINWDIKKYFDETKFVHHNYIVELEEELKAEGIETVLTKPHPFVFLKGVFGDEISDYDIINGKFDKERCRRTLVVGDALCDLNAAKAAGCDFLAVLTGVQGKNAREFFEKEEATYILDDVLGLCEEV